MRAMLLRQPRTPLEAVDLPAPVAGDGQLLIRVHCCAVCRTDLHVVDGELPSPKLPLVIGHQIAGVVLESRADGFAKGDRLGVPWLGWTCGVCRYCTSGRENLCDSARFTGYTIDGGYAELAVADARFCFRLPDAYSFEEAAPLLCAGLIGYRAYRMAGDAKRIGFYGFGSAAQIVTQLAKADGREVFAFTREGDEAAQAFAREMGAVSAGGSQQRQELDAAIIFAPVGELVVEALRNVAKGGSVVCAGIHMSDIPSFPYELLWGERVIRSVANLTRADGDGMFALAAKTAVRTQRHLYPLERANEALNDLRAGAITGTAILEIP